MKARLEKVISGGQTGVDRAGLDAALGRGIPVGGSCPLGRRAEDGTIPDAYPLTETRSRSYDVRTRMNVRAGDATLVLNSGELSGGTLYTVVYAAKRNKPCLVVQLDDAAHATPGAVAEWLGTNAVRTLNIAGPREGKAPGIHLLARMFLEQVFGLVGR
ncbi:MAG TPA: putative molybdenum carrier protein [Desulfuromonadaceae bacterium]